MPVQPHTSCTEGLAAHNVIALNAFHRVAGIHHQGCVLRDPGVIVIRMICDDQHTVVFGDVGQRYAFHLQIVMAAFADKRKIGIVVADFSAILLQQLNNRQGRRLAQVIDVFLVGHPQHQHFGAFERLGLLIESLADG